MSNREIKISIQNFKNEKLRRNVLRNKPKNRINRKTSYKLKSSFSVKSAPIDIIKKDNKGNRLNRMLRQISSKSPLNSASAIEKIVHRKMKSLNFLQKSLNKTSKKKVRIYKKFEEVTKSYSRETKTNKSKSKISKLYNLTRAKTASDIRKKLYSNITQIEKPQSCMKLNGLEKLLKVKQIVESPKPRFFSHKKRENSKNLRLSMKKTDTYNKPRNKKYFDMRHLLLQKNYTKKNFKKFLELKNEYKLDSHRFHKDAISSTHWEPGLGSYRFSTERDKEKNCLPLEMLKLRKELLGNYDKVDRSVFFEIGLELLEDEDKSKGERVNSSKIWKEDKGINFGLDYGDKKWRNKPLDVAFRDRKDNTDLDGIYPGAKILYANKERKSYNCSISLLNLKRKKVVYRKRGAC